MNPVSRFDAIQHALTRPGLSALERVVLTYLIQRMRTSGRKRRLTWPTAVQIAEDIEVSERQVRRALSRMAELGVVQRWRRPNNYDYRIPPVWDEVACDVPSHGPTRPRRVAASD